MKDKLPGPKDITFNEYEIINGKKFRMGYTTGSCAAAASKAAVYMLLEKEKIEYIKIYTPKGINLNLPVDDIEFLKASVKCAVIKDGGDDPDITSGLRVYAEASFLDEDKIEITAGEGIGIVTLPGLKVEVGQPAINPVPRQMIIEEVKKVLPKGRGIKLTLSIPGGSEIAKKTYNPKLGIIGGISVLGTTGIVRPMSEEAWKDSLALELNVLKERNVKDIVFNFGNIGEEFAVNKLGLDKTRMITISNFVGFMLDKALENDFHNILIVGHLGKLVKVACGNFHTHSRVSDGRLETIVSYAALEGGNLEVLNSLYNCRTTDECAKIIENNNLQNIYKRISENAARRCTEYTFGKIRVGTVLFKDYDDILYIDGNGKEIIELIRCRYGK